MPWLYEPDENPKRKHAWDHPSPGFVDVCGTIVGKCPSGLSIARAQALLNFGIPWHRPRAPEKDWPDAIYVVYDGAVYRAKPTRPGVSYHAFPELPQRLRELPREMLDRIVQHAEQRGCAKEVRR